MPLIVQKYGGSSVADAGRIRHVAQRVAAAKSAGNQVVVVVSAMGDTTDDLIDLAKQITDQPSPREMDLLLSTGETISMTLMSMALHGLDCDAISLSGAQAGIRTDTLFSRARILSIDPTRVRQELGDGKVVIVAGFQGINEDQDVTTLGRGGSDTTAVALACALTADECQIFTDVTGIYTADPRVAPEARKLKDISYEEMLEMATLGARVMHPRSVELGSVYGMPIRVASSFGSEPGTLIHEVSSMEARNKVRGIAHDLDVAKITIVGVPDRPGIAATIFAPLAAAGLSVDTIVQNAGREKFADLTFTLSKTDLPRAMKLVQGIAKDINARDCISDSDLGKVSIVGTGIQNAPGYAARMFETLFKERINIEMITTSEIRITCVVAENRVADAVRALHRAFELEQPED
ncbi:MAG: aspartate kinase [Dehalococcoidia bacterium]|nr:aspartate kinase [Dehalococcoidia bacterium]